MAHFSSGLLQWVWNSSLNKSRVHRLELSNYDLLICILVNSADPYEVLVFSDIASGSAVFAKVSI